MVVLLGRFELPSTAPETGVLSIELQEHKKINLLIDTPCWAKVQLKLQMDKIYFIIILIFFKI